MTLLGGTEKGQATQVFKANALAPNTYPMVLEVDALSSSAFTAFRPSGLLKLPSERTLRDYSNWMKAKPEFMPEVDKQLIEETDS